MNPIKQAVKNLPGHWYQGGYGGSGGNYCGLGHMMLAHSNAVDFQDAYRIANDNYHLEKTMSMWEEMNNAALDKFPERAVTDSGAKSFAFFNDHPDTTEQDVIDVMNLAAERWEIENESNS